MKLRYELIPSNALAETAKAFTIGAIKHSDYGWKKGFKWEDGYGALQRHANAWWGGEWVDEETGLNHLACVIANAMMLYELQVSNKGECKKHDANE